MSQGDIAITVEVPEEVDITVESPDIDLTIVPSPEIILITANNVGPQGPQGEPGVGILPADVVIPASSFVIRNELLSADTQPAFRLMGDGKIEWGPGGGTVPDTNLFRKDASVLKTDDGFEVGATLYALGTIVFPGSAHEMYKANGTFFIGTTGGLEWGPGDWSRDVSLYRAAANVLKTDDNFWVSGGVLQLSEAAVFGPSAFPALQSDGTNLYIMADSGILFLRPRAQTNFGMLQLEEAAAGAKLTFYGADGAGDTTLYRAAADVLKTDDQFYAGSLIQSDVDIYARAGTSRVRIGNSGPGGESGISFGVSGNEDTKLYRYAAGYLATDGQLYFRGGNNSYLAFAWPGEQARFFINPSGNLNWGSGAGAQDTNLYRVDPGVLKSDGQLHLVGNLYAAWDGVGYGLQVNPGGLSVRGNLAAGAGNTGAIYGFNFVPAVFNTGSRILNAVKVSGDSQPIFLIDAVGGLSWGPGGAAGVDVNLYRRAADFLRSDDNLTLGGGLYFGTAGSEDVVLYRAAAGVIKTDNHLHIANDIDVGGDLASGRFIVSNNVYIRDGMMFHDGSNYDVNLFRSAANILKTDDSMIIAGGLALGAQTPPAAGSIKFGDGTTQSTAGGASALAPATTLPGSPTDKQQAILTDSTTAPTWQWLCQYDSSISDSYKWRVIGPIPLVASGKNNTISAGMTTIVSLAAPRSGVYNVDLNITAGNGASDPQPEVRVIGVVVEYNDAAGAQYSRMKTVSYKGRHTLAATNTVDARSQANGSDPTWSQAAVALTPIRIS